MKHRAALWRRARRCRDWAATGVSGKHLAAIWSALEEDRGGRRAAGKLQELWRNARGARGRSGEGGAGGVRTDAGVRGWRSEKSGDAVFEYHGGKGPAAPTSPSEGCSIHHAEARHGSVAGEGEMDHKPAVIEPETTNALGPGATRLVKNKPDDPDLFVPQDHTSYGSPVCSLLPDMFYIRAQPELLRHQQRPRAISRRGLSQRRWDISATTSRSL